MNNQLLESLETRQLFSSYMPFHVTPTHTLVIRGSAGDDSINVFLIHGKKEDGIGVTIQVHGSSPLSPTPTLETRLSFNSVKRILIDAGAGDDKITLTGPLASDPSDQATLLPIPATVLGGAGNDIIGPDLMGPLLAVGGAGNDTLSSGTTDLVLVDASKNSDVLDEAFENSGGQFASTLMGGAGNDVLTGNVNDQVDGGAGIDTGEIVIKANDVATANNISVDRGDALAHDYYQRLGATSLEQATAPSRVVTAGASFGLIKSVIGDA